MKILFFTDHFKPEPSAPAAHVYERAQMWSRLGHDVTVLCGAPNFPEGKVYAGYKNKWRFVEYMDGVRVVRVKTFIARNEGFVLRIIDYISYMLSSFINSLFEKKPDVVISTSPHLFVPMAGVACSIVKRVPHVFELRDLWPASIASVVKIKPGLFYRMLERLELFLYKKSKRILSFTRSFAEDLVSRGVSRDKIDVVLGGANLKLFSRRSRDRSIEDMHGLCGRFVVGYLGTMGLAHGLENVLKTAEILKNSNAVFLFVGVGAAKLSLEMMARDHGLSNVVFVSRQLKENMPGYWSVCDAALIHLRDQEVFTKVVPSKIFEAMAMGLPIIYAGPAGEGSSIVERHGAGVWVPPDNPQALAGAVMSLSLDERRCAEFADNSFSSACNYSRERQAEGTLSVLQKAIDDEKSGVDFAV
ncbi:MAG: glycosyltransferase family 4 protein [Pseudomonadota bacterium]